MTGSSCAASAVGKDAAVPGNDNMELLAWLEKAAAATPFGEVGISLVLHDGKIVRVRRTLEETHRVQANRDGNP